MNRKRSNNLVQFESHAQCGARIAPAARGRIGKVVIQIPCYNEAETLAVAVGALPKELDGVDSVEWLIIDDGSQDDTASVARRAGVHHIVVHPRNRGLARAFETGLEQALALGADVIVNTDADNQYCAADIVKLVEPIRCGEADMVIGTRPVRDMDNFSPLKKLLQTTGSAFVRGVSNTSVEDAPSGFRALTRDAAMRLHVFGDYTYTLETIIQAGHTNMTIATVDVRVNADLRPSRLVHGMASYVFRSVATALRIFITYRPFRFFVSLGSLFLGAGCLLGLRFLSSYFAGDGGGHVQSLILTAICVVVGFQFVVVGVVADLISVNRKLLQKIDWRVQALGSPRRDAEVRSGASSSNRRNAL